MIQPCFFCDCEYTLAMQVMKKDTHYRHDFVQYFWDIDPFLVSEQAFICRVLDKWTLEDMKLLTAHIWSQQITRTLETVFAYDRPVFSPSLTKLFISWFHISDDIWTRALTTAKKNDFFGRSV